MRRPARCLLAVLVAAMFGQAAQNLPNGAGEQDSRLTTAIPLGLTELWSGSLAKGQSQWFVLKMTKGSFARLRVGLEHGYVQAHLFPPGAMTAAERTYAAETDVKDSVLAWAAASSGNYLLQVEANLPSQKVCVQLEGLESPELYAARAAAVKTDPRVRSLSDHMLRWNSLDPESDDLADLRPLGELLKGVRIVLLGEASHFDGTDFLAKTRLIQFLHRELGFDVLAFEAGIYQMRLAWQAFQTGVDPQEAFSKGAFWMWARSAQVEPLVRHIARSLKTDRPLEISGVDNQISSAELPQNLRDFLKGKDIATSFTDPASPESEILAAVVGSQSRKGARSLLDSATKVSFLESLGQLADKIGQLEPGRDASFWHQVLANVAQYARRRLSLLDQPGTIPRDRQMAENLIWMAKDYYPGRKIIVWCHSGHAIRVPSKLPANPIPLQTTLADYVYDVFGQEMYSIAPVSYGGRWAYGGLDYTVVSDQVPDAEFEELMAATGQIAAFVDLRQIGKRAHWLAGPFVARPWEHVSIRSVWRDHFDAFVFLKEQEPSKIRISPGKSLD
ncbi:MAG: erythromycin esterase family protein [Candidatus Aminicenantes bacterium]|nr:erythromycin esterase family protein [Candidatus Aminicenantes bacterium]